MRPYMNFQVLDSTKPFPANVTRVRLLQGVNPHMNLHFVPRIESLPLARTSHPFALIIRSVGSVRVNMRSVNMGHQFA